MNDERTNAKESCEAIEPLLSAYLLEELPGAERPRVTAHLEDCPRCRRELAGIEAAVKLLAAAPGTEGALAVGQRARILQQAASGPAAPAGSGTGAAAGPGRRNWSRSLAWIGSLAAAAVVAGVAGQFLLREDLGSRTAGGGAVEVASSRSTTTPPPASFESFEKLSVEGAREMDRATLAAKDSPPLEPGNGEVIAKDKDLLALRDETARTTGGLALDLTEARKEAEKRELTLAAAAPAPKGGVELSKKMAEQLVEEQRGASRGFYFNEESAASEAKQAADGANPNMRRSTRFAGRLLTPAVGAAGPGVPGQQGVQESENLALLQPNAAAPESLRQGVPPPESRRGLERADPYRLQSAGGAGGRAVGAPAPGAAAKPSADSAEEAKAEAGGAAASAAPAGEAVAAPESAPRAEAPAAKAPARLAAGAVVQQDARGATIVETDWRARVEERLTRLDRRPGETPQMMFFRYWGTNPFVEASSDPLSTFAADVDTASYALFRSYLTERGLLPPRDAIRTEEFVNYFKSAYPPPTAEGEAFAIHTEIAPSVFAHEPDYKLLKVGLKAREVSREKRQACSLVFVVDTSGSMRQGNRLETVKEALRLLVPELDEGDTIGIVAFDREARTILDPVPASEKERILSAIATLQPRQNTNVNAGLELGYGMATAKRIKDGSNRVILLSDGVANTGVTEPQAMLDRVRSQRQGGIYLTCVGVGMGNHNDALLEALADGGDGQCVYVDQLEEARKVFVDNLTGTLQTIARDVKIQVEFDPARVIRYRLLGYENRAVADARFRDNTVDAGEVGAGHEVTALYELKLKPEAAGKLATVRLRYLTVDHGEAVEMERAVETASVKGAFADSSPRFQLSSCVAEAAEILRESYWARGSNLRDVTARLEALGPQLGTDKDFPELIALLKRADVLVRDRQGGLDDVARAEEAVKEQNFLQLQAEAAGTGASERDRAHLEEIRRQSQELRQRLEALLQRR